jgi:hypothetical protein
VVTFGSDLPSHYALSSSTPAFWGISPLSCSYSSFIPKLFLLLVRRGQANYSTKIVYPNPQPIQNSPRRLFKSLCNCCARSEGVLNALHYPCSDLTASRKLDTSFCRRSTAVISSSVSSQFYSLLHSPPPDQYADPARHSPGKILAKADLQPKHARPCPSFGHELEATATCYQQTLSFLYVCHLWDVPDVVNGLKRHKCAHPPLFHSDDRCCQQ